MADEGARKKRRSRRSRTSEKTSTEDSNIDNRWSNLPEELLGQIMNRLPFSDHCNINNVCKSWHYSCISYHSLSIPLPRKKQMLPWLLNISWSKSRMFDPMSRRTYTINMNPLKDKIKHINNWEVCESKSGYLLIVSSTGSVSSIGRAGVPPQPPSPNGNNIFDIEYYLVMYTPFFANNNLLELPVLNLKGPILLATFDIKSSSYSSIGFKFFALGFVTNEIVSINTCRSGDDTWSSSQNIRCGFLLSDVRRWMYSQGKFYYATPDPNIGAFDLDKREGIVFRVPYSCKGFDDIHMIKSIDGNHLYIFCYWRKDWSQRFKLDLSQSSWERIGNKSKPVVVFVGNGYKSVIELGEGCGAGGVDGYLSGLTMANTIYICTGLGLSYTRFSNDLRTYQCTRHYGSLATKQCVKHIWIETPY